MIMEYKHYKNTNMHCVQACLQTLLYYFDMTVLSFDELDKITGHGLNTFTWMSKTLLWLSEQFNVIHIENLDYSQFARDGKEYLKDIWDTEIFRVQNSFSNLDKEQINANELIKNKNIRLINRRSSMEDIKSFFEHNYFILLSINHNVLNGVKEYGSHMVIVAGFKDGKVKLVDPDEGIIWHEENRLKSAISQDNKPDFSMTLVSRITNNRLSHCGSATD